MQKALKKPINNELKGAITPGLISTIKYFFIYFSKKVETNEAFCGKEVANEAIPLIFQAVITLMVDIVDGKLIIDKEDHFRIIDTSFIMYAQYLRTKKGRINIQSERNIFELYKIINLKYFVLYNTPRN